MDAAEFRWGGETLVALAAKALWWPRCSTLCIADVHLGKPAAFRHAGVPVPESTTGVDLNRLTHLIASFNPNRLVFLGDLLHARTGRAPDTMDAFAAWRIHHAQVDMLLIRGNHDRNAGDPPADWSVRSVDEPFAEEDDGDIMFAHHPEASADAGNHNLLCGHIHPGVSMIGSTTSLRAPCFWFQPHIGVLPAFGSFTGMKAVMPGKADRVFAVGPGEILEVGHQSCDRKAITPGRSGRRR